jgi:hypothetical protein
VDTPLTKSLVLGVPSPLPPLQASSAAPTSPKVGSGVAHSSGGVLGQLRGRVEKHLSARHAAERLLRCWGAGELCERGGGILGGSVSL